MSANSWKTYFLKRIWTAPSRTFCKRRLLAILPVRLVDHQINWLRHSIFGDKIMLQNK
jgi:hypothetical protein